MNARCTCPPETLGKFWRLRYPERPRQVFHVACGRLRLIERDQRPLTAR